MIIPTRADVTVTIDDRDPMCCGTRCLLLYAMFDRCGLSGRLKYNPATKKFYRSDKCVQCTSLHESEA